MTQSLHFACMNVDWTLHRAEKSMTWGVGGLVHDKQNQAGKVKNGNRLQDVRKKKSEVQIIDLEKIIYRL